MKNILVRVFVKNSEEINDPKVRSAYGTLTGIVGILCNVILFTVKFIIGGMIHSVSVTADAFNNLSDSFSSFISLIGVRLAAKPADSEHPFGHGRYEYVTALVVSFLVLQVGFTCFESSVKKIIRPEKVEFRLAVIFILLFSVLVKAWLAFFNLSLGKKINSSVMRATAQDAKSDVLITLSTVLSLVISEASGFNLDGYIGALVSCFIFYSGFQTIRDTLRPLLGQAAEKELFIALSDKIMSYDYIIGTHDMIVHRYGPGHTMATVHCEVPNNMSIEQAHDVIDQIERDVLREMNIFLVIHMDPIEMMDEHVKKVCIMVEDIVTQISKRATIHDFRLVNGSESINLIFDLLLPHNIKKKEQEEIKEKICEKVREKDPKYHCIITVESGYIAE